MHSECGNYYVKTSYYVIQAWLWHVNLKCGLSRCKWLIVSNANCAKWNDDYDDEYDDDLMMMNMMMMMCDEEYTYIKWWRWKMMMLTSDDVDDVL